MTNKYLYHKHIISTASQFSRVFHLAHIKNLNYTQSPSLFSILHILFFTCHFTNTSTLNMNNHTRRSITHTHTPNKTYSSNCDPIKNHELNPTPIPVQSIWTSTVQPKSGRETCSKYSFQGHSFISNLNIILGIELLNIIKLRKYFLNSQENPHHLKPQNNTPLNPKVEQLKS